MPLKDTVCSVPACERPVSARGLCKSHYSADFYHRKQTTETRPCLVTGCQRPLRTRGYCNAHYRLFQKWGETLAPPEREVQTCSVPGCAAPHLAKGFCNRHYLRLTFHGDAGTADPPPTAEQRFWSSVEKQTEPPYHWLWTGALSQAGYGTFKVEGRWVAPHVYVFTALGIARPDGQLVRHRCPGGNVRRCLNPDHLLGGTPKQNMADRDEDGTTARGERHHNVRLTDAQIDEMRALLAAGERPPELARRFGIARGYAWRIVVKQDVRRLATGPIAIGAGITRSVRRAVFERDRGVCQICAKIVGPKDRSLDHIIPRSRGGSDDMANLRLVHQRCNSSRGNKGAVQLTLL